MMPPIHGNTAKGFDSVRDAFADNFTGAHSCVEIGASFSAYRNGEPLVQLWGGHADGKRTREWTEHTVVNIFSATKGVVACCVAVLAGQGRLDFDATVASYWPEFAQGGKAKITVAQMLSHQGGLSGVRVPTSPDDLLNWNTMIKRLEMAEPLWVPGSTAGYHAITWGYLAGELVRRVAGKSVGTFLQEDITRPIGADVFIGLTSSTDHPIAEMLKATGAQTQTFAEMSEILQLTLGNPLIEAEVANDPRWQKAEVPAANGQGNAEGLARLYSAFATDGTFEGKRLLAAGAIAAATREMFHGVDINLGKTLGWAASGFFVRNEWNWFGPNSQAFGHSGWGGSLAFADPSVGLSVAYVPNQMDTNLQGDPRALRLINALYSCI